MTGKRVTLLASATPLNAPHGVPTQLFVTAPAGSGIDIGDDTVTAGAGYPLAAAASLPWPILLAPNRIAYAIGTTSAVVSVIVSPVE